MREVDEVKNRRFLYTFVCIVPLTENSNYSNCSAYALLGMKCTLHVQRTYTSHHDTSHSNMGNGTG